VAYPILLGRMHPDGHPAYPGMGSFFPVQAGGGRYPEGPSPPTARAAARFLERRAGLPAAAVEAAERRGVSATLRALTALQVPASVHSRAGEGVRVVGDWG
jgi:hypothetical protein